MLALKTASVKNGQFGRCCGTCLRTPSHQRQVICAIWVATIKLAHMLDSLVRVSRRADWGRSDSIRGHATRLCLLNRVERERALTPESGRKRNATSPHEKEKPYAAAVTPPATPARPSESGQTHAVQSLGSGSSRKTREKHRHKNTKNTTPIASLSTISSTF